MSKLLKLLAASCLLTSCQIDTTDSEHKLKQEGESVTRVVVELSYIQEIRELCEAAIDAGEPERAKLVATCTLENIQLLNLDVGGIDGACGKPQPGLTPEQQAELDQVCQILEGGL